jgi:hypothetical protein
MLFCSLFARKFTNCAVIRGKSACFCKEKQEFTESESEKVSSSKRGSDPSGKFPRLLAPALDVPGVSRPKQRHVASDQ